MRRPVVAGEIHGATHSRPAGGDHHREPDGRRDRAHLHYRGPSLSRRHSLALSDPVPDPARLVAGVVHLHVHLDGEVRRRLWRANRHPCRRRRADQAPQCQMAEGRDSVRPARRRAVHRHRRHHGGEVRLRADAHRPGLARPGDSELDRLRLHSARLLPDVLPLPSGVLALLLDRRIAASRCDQHRWHRSQPDRAGRDRRSVMSAAFIFGLLFALMLTGMPISISLGLTVLTFLFTMTEVPIESVGLKLFSGLDNFGIMAIPFFILAGTFLTRGGVARRMIAFTTSVVGHLPGGLGLAGVAACAMFAAISGSSVATVVAIGSIMMPAMVEHGYPKRFGVGVISTSGALGILVPPSIILVLYGVSTNTSIGALFMAGIVPGILLASMLAAVTWFIAYRNGYPKMPRATLMQQWTAFRESLWGLLLIVIVLGGIYGGVFTPTEAAAVAATYAFFITVFVYKELKLNQVGKVLLQAASMSSMLLYIITNAVLFSFLMTHEQIPQEMAAWIIDKNFGVWSFLLVVNVILLAAGNVMDPSSILLIMAPILFPLATKIGIHPVHLGVLMIVNTEVGLCHPPVGLNLYIASGIAKMGISEITMAVLPWLCAMLVFLGLITYVPEISLWLPRLLGMIQ